MKLIMNGEISQKTSSGLFPLSLSNSAVRYFLLFTIGSFAMVVHARLRLHLGIPGHQGLLYMATLVGASSLLSTRFAGLTFAAGSSLILSLGLLGFGNPFMAAEYMFLGIVADVFLNLSRNRDYKVLYIILVGALGYGMIPVVRMIITSISGYPFGSFVKYGFGVTLISHIAFGVLGSLSGFGISKLICKKK